MSDVLDELRGLLPENEIEALAKLAAQAQNPAVCRRWAQQEAEQRAVLALADQRERERGKAMEGLDPW